VYVPAEQIVANKKNIEFAKKYVIPTVITQDILYVEEEDVELHELVIKMKNKEKKKIWRTCNLTIHDVVSVRVEPKWLNPNVKYVEVIFTSPAGEEGYLTLFGAPGMTVTGWGDFPKRRERMRKKTILPDPERSLLREPAGEKG
jgi:hypothetical protein